MKSLKKLFGLGKDEYKEAMKVIAIDNELKMLEGLKRIRDLIDSYDEHDYPKDRVEAILKLFIDKSFCKHDDVRAMAISGLGHMARGNLIPSQHLEKVLQVCLEKYDDLYETARCNAIWSVNNLADRQMIPMSKVDHVLETMIDGLNDPHNDARSNAIWCIGKLALNNLIPENKYDLVVGCILFQTNDSYDLARVNAVGCLGRFSENNMIPEIKIHKVLTAMIAKLSDMNEAVKNNAIWCISGLALNNLIDQSKIEMLLQLMLDIAYQREDSSKSKAMACIYNIAQYNIIPSLVVDRLLQLMIEFGDDFDDVVRFHSIWVLCDLAESNSIPAAEIDRVLSLLISKMEDALESVRVTAIKCISNLIENNVVPPNKLRMIFMVMISHFDDDADELKTMSIQCVGNLARNNRIPQSKMEQVLLLMFSKLDDPFDDTRAAAMRCIGFLARSKVLSRERIEEVIINVMDKASDKNGSVRCNSLWCSAILAENKLILHEYLEDLLNLVIRKLYDVDVGVRVTACFCVAFLCTQVRCDMPLIGKCIALLLSVEDDEDWKFRAIEALCAFSETEIPGLQDSVNQAIFNAHKLGESFYDTIPSHQRRLEISTRLDKAVNGIIAKERKLRENIKPSDKLFDYGMQDTIRAGSNPGSRSVSPLRLTDRRISMNQGDRGNLGDRGNVVSPLGRGGWTDMNAFGQWRSMQKRKSVTNVSDAFRDDASSTAPSQPDSTSPKVRRRHAVSDMSQEQLSEIRDTSTVTNYSDDMSVQTHRTTPPQRRKAIISIAKNFSQSSVMDDGSLISAQVQQIPEVEAVVLPDEITVTEQDDVVESLGSDDDEKGSKQDPNEGLDIIPDNSGSSLDLEVNATEDLTFDEVSNEILTTDMGSSESKQETEIEPIPQSDMLYDSVEESKNEEYISSMQPDSTLQAVGSNRSVDSTMVAGIIKVFDLAKHPKELESPVIIRMGSEIDDRSSMSLSRSSRVGEDLPPIRDKISAYETLISRKKSFEDARSSSRNIFSKPRVKRQTSTDSYSSSPKDIQTRKVGFGSSSPRDFTLRSNRVYP